MSRLRRGRVVIRVPGVPLTDPKIMVKPEPRKFHHNRYFVCASFRKLPGEPAMKAGDFALSRYFGASPTTRGARRKFNQVVPTLRAEGREGPIRVRMYYGDENDKIVEELIDE